MSTAAFCGLVSRSDRGIRSRQRSRYDTSTNQTEQAYAKRLGVLESAELRELVESALKLQAAACERQAVTVVREYENLPPAIVDKHKVLQILVNLLQNARRACEDAHPAEKKIVVRLRRNGEDRVRIEVTDNGIGIASENMTKIFSHGFTTRAHGHGFGLHGAALAAEDMEGTLVAQSEGLGKGATFALEVPLRPATAPSGS